MDFFRLNPAAAAEDVEHSEQCRTSWGPTIAPHRELKEQDLLRLLEEKSSEDPNSTVDCTLKLGLPSETTSRPLIKDQNPQFDGQNFYSPAKVMNNYAMMNGGYNLYNRWGHIDPSNMNWTPMGFGGRRDGVGYYASSSMALPAAASIFNRDYARFSALARQQSTVPMGGGFFPPKPADGGYMDCVRKCSKCETTTTPLWRNGPKGAKSLCNACGIRYKKEERRALGIPDPHSKPKGSVPKEPEQSKKARY